MAPPHMTIWLMLRSVDMTETIRVPTRELIKTIAAGHNTSKLVDLIGQLRFIIVCTARRDGVKRS